MGCGNSSPTKHMTNSSSSSKSTGGPAEFSSKLSDELVPEDDKRKATERLALPQEAAVGGLTLALMKSQACACFSVCKGRMTQQEGVCRVRKKETLQASISSSVLSSGTHRVSAEQQQQHPAEPISYLSVPSEGFNRIISTWFRQLQRPQINWLESLQADWTF